MSGQICGNDTFINTLDNTYDPLESVNRMEKSLKLIFWVFVCIVMLATNGTAQASPDSATISIEPSEVLDVSPGGTFSINVTITGVSELFGWQINITFNPQILNVESMGEGPFLKQQNDTIFMRQSDNTVGYAFVSAIFNPPYPSYGASGSGLLGNITFSVKGSGSSSLHFGKNTKLKTVIADNLVAITDFSTTDGSFRNAAGGLQLGIPIEFIAGAVVVVAVIGVSVFALLRRRKKAL